MYIMLGPVPGTRRQGGQRRQWLDDLTQWTGMRLPELVRTAEDREQYRRLIHSAPTLRTEYGKFDGCGYERKGTEDAQPRSSPLLEKFDCMREARDGGLSVESHTAGNPRMVMRGGMAAVGLFRLTLGSRATGRNGQEDPSPHSEGMDTVPDQGLSPLPPPSRGGGCE